MPLIGTSIAKIYTADQGSQAALPPLLLIHGAGGTHLDWPAALRRWPGRRVIAPDLPGHGKSVPPGRPTITAYAADLIALLDALEVEQVIAVGHSMGGAIALTLALDFAERLVGLVLIGTGAKLSVHPDILTGIQTNQAMVAQQLGEWLWSDRATADQRAWTVTQFTEQPAGVIYEDYVACNGFDVRSRLGEIALPTLIFAGANDKMTPLKFSQFLQQNIPGARLVTLDGAGHMMALEQPEAIAGAMQDWLHSSGL